MTAEEENQDLWEADWDDEVGALGSWSQDIHLENLRAEILLVGSLCSQSLCARCYPRTQMVKHPIEGGAPHRPTEVAGVAEYLVPAGWALGPQVQPDSTCCIYHDMATGRHGR